MGPFAAIEFSEFIRHFRKLDDAAIAIDIRQSMDDVEELTADGESFGALMVRKMNARIAQNRERNRINGSKGGRPPKKLTNDPCPGKSADIPNAQQSRKAAVPGTPAEGEGSLSSPSAKGRGDIPGIGEFKNVRITAEERRKLERDFGDVSGLIEEMSSYKAAKGKAYKNDCAALRNWAKRRLDEGRSIDGKKMSQQERMRLYFEQKAVEIRQRETAGGMDELV